MFYQSHSLMRAQECELQHENIDIAIRLYEGAHNTREEDRWLDLIERALHNLLVFNEDDLDMATREKRKKRHAALLAFLQEKIHLRKDGKISRFQLAKELHQIYSDIRNL